MGLLVYLLAFWTLSHIFHEYLAGKRHKTRRKLKHLRKNLVARIRLDSDILLEKNRTVLQELADQAKTLLDAEDTTLADMEKFLKGADKKVEKACPTPSHSGIRETIEMLVVVFGIVMGIRAIAMQPFKIPTGSMQPTLFGVHFEPVEDLKVPGRLKQIFDWVNYSAGYVDVTIKDGGQVDPYQLRDASLRIGGFALVERTEVELSGHKYLFPGTRSQVYNKLLPKVSPTRHFESGQRISGLTLTGDHIMVDRFSYRFIEPTRGDIFVFVTDGITNPDGSPLSGRHYIKRLVGLPGDTLKIVNGRLYVKEKGAPEFVVVDGQFDKAFERIYSGKGGYHGYTFGSYLMTDNGEEVILADDQYFAMGDNSGNSHDSRGWGVVPRRNIIGKAMLVWWPFSRRWGPVDRVEPLDFASPNLSHLDDE